MNSGIITLWLRRYLSRRFPILTVGPAGTSYSGCTLDFQRIMLETLPNSRMVVILSSFTVVLLDYPSKVSSAQLLLLFDFSIERPFDLGWERYAFNLALIPSYGNHS